LIVYFDGYCNLCNAWVDRILRTERGARFYFAPLSGTTAKERLPAELHREGPDAIVLQEGERFLTGAKAAFRIARFLRWPYSMLRSLRIFPQKWADRVYSWIARNRYKWYGKRQECRLPSPKEKERFLD
jgi:predicted DCC family thiol-disulfide oxidoreductase YuxK